MSRSLRLAVSAAVLGALVLGSVSATIAGGPKVLDARMVGIPTDGLALHGIAGGGVPWAIDEGRAKLFADGRLQVEVRGLVVASSGVEPGGHRPRDRDVLVRGGRQLRRRPVLADRRRRRRHDDQSAVDVPRPGGLLRRDHRPGRSMVRGDRLLSHSLDATWRPRRRRRGLRLPSLRDGANRPDLRPSGGPSRPPPHRRVDPVDRFEPNLRIPGPTALPPSVRQAGARQMINHRGPEFAAMLERILTGMKPFFGTTSDVAMLTTAGSGGLEAAVVNTMSPGDRVLGVSIGSFGDRFAKIAGVYGANVTKLDVEWGQAADPARRPRGACRGSRRTGPSC